MEDALATLAAVTSGVFLIPQLRRMRRSSDGDGVSPAAAGVGLVSTLAWATYGFGTGTLPVVVPSLVGAAQYAILLALLRASGSRTATGMAAATAWSLCLAGATAASTALGHKPWPGLGAALTVAVVVQYIPAVLEAFRSESVSGVAAATWLLVCANGVIWTAYGFLITDAVVTAYGLALVAAACAVLTALRLPVHRGTTRTMEWVVGHGATVDHQVARRRSPDLRWAAQRSRPWP